MSRFLARAREAERQADLYRDAGEQLAGVLRSFAARHRPGCRCRICEPLAQWSELTEDSWLT